MKKLRGLPFFWWLISFLFISLLFFLPKDVNAATGNSTGKAAKYYGGYETSTPWITINGIPAFCINPDKPWPINQSYAEKVYYDVGVYNILYYAEQKGYFTKESTYVDTFVALNWYLGHRTYRAQMEDPTVKWLYNKAKNPDAPRGGFDIQNKVQTATFKSGNSYQETSWYKPVSSGTGINYTVTVPKNITLITNDNKTYQSGKVTLSQKQQFKLRANVDYSGTVSLNASTNVLSKYTLLFVPTNPNVQRLLTIKPVTDPVTVPNIKATFYKRTAKGNVIKKDNATGAGLSGAEYQVKNMTTGKTWSVTTGKNGSISWGETTIGDKLQITETKAPKNYILDATPKSITVKSGNNDVIFKNEKMAELQLKKIQIYTGKAEKGLPIKIYTKRVQTSTEANKSSVEINVYDAGTSKKVLSLPYTIKDLPETVESVIPSNVLTVNQKVTYIAKIEKIDSKSTFITKGYESVDTEGYSSSEANLTIKASEKETLSFKGVVMTEREVGKDIKRYYETFDMPTNKIKEQKTGYGFTRDFDTTYTNDLQSRSDYDLIMQVDSKLVDSFYQVSANDTMSDVRLEQTLRSDFDGKDKRSFQLPHVHVEKKTGNIFMDKQVENKDNRIRYELRDGGRKFYVPVWGELGEYNIALKNEQPVGVNQINFSVTDTINIYAQMVATQDSKTKDIDEILIQPIDSKNAFSNGIPDNFGYISKGKRYLTDEEKDFFYEKKSNEQVLITYQGESGKNISSEKVNIGQSYRISNEIPVKTGYFFDGWQSSVDGKTYQVGDIIKPSENVVFTAVWTTKKIAVVYDANGGIKSPVNENLQAGTTYTISSDYPSREGFTFKGWKSSLDGKVLPAGSVMTITKDLTLTAQWEVIKRIITYDDGQTKQEVTEVQGATHKISIANPTKAGFTFKGWKWDRLYKKDETIKVENENILFEAVWSRNEIAITYIGNEGQNIPDNDTSFALGNYTIASDQPSKVYSHFVGWKNSVDNKIYQPKEIIKTGEVDIRLIAQWEDETSNIIYDFNGGTGNFTNSKQSIGKTYKIPTGTATKLGYSLTGFENSYDGKIYKVGDIIDVQEEDTTLTAQWETGRYQVSYDSLGGDKTPDSETIGYNQLFYVRDIIPAKEGYIFKGWKSSQDNKVYVVGDSFVVTKDIVLTAVWELKQYTVNYNLNGGTGAVTSATVKHGEKHTVSATIPTKEGYTFKGWKSSMDSKIYVSGNQIVVMKDMTLTAEWEIKKYSVTYSMNGGTGTITTATVNHGSTHKVSSVVPAKTGYTFKGWQSSSDSRLYTSGNDITIKQDTTLTAIWIINQYTVTYGVSGGNGSVSPVTVNYGSKYQVSSIVPTREGYNFKGWQSSVDNKIYSAGDSIEVTSDVLLLAVWELKQYTVNYNLNGGTGQFNAATVSHGTLHTISIELPKRTGYIFKGWKSSLGGNANIGGKFTVTDNTTLTAQWELRTYSINFIGTDNSKISSEFLSLKSVPGKTTAKHGTSYTLAATKPRRIEYTYEFTFTGWKEKNTGKVYQPGSKLTIDGDKTFVAQWKTTGYIHIVKYGDTLWSLSRKYYGDSLQYNKLKTLNKLKTDRIDVNQILIYK
ncbi:InlB B-repeat-containing protein [Vagococcus sp.]|uniref:InlB B-repeat-containing protein n=1 Tax=Vagococcus sp. TaxID=1933889 RepID=UPI002FC9B766